MALPNGYAYSGESYINLGEDPATGLSKFKITSGQYNGTILSYTRVLFNKSNLEGENVDEEDNLALAFDYFIHHAEGEIHPDSPDFKAVIYVMLIDIMLRWSEEQLQSEDS